jgi:hypothetical protein
MRWGFGSHRPALLASAAVNRAAADAVTCAQFRDGRFTGYVIARYRGPIASCQRGAFGKLQAALLERTGGNGSISTREAVSAFCGAVNGIGQLLLNRGADVASLPAHFSDHVKTLHQ